MTTIKQVNELFKARGYDVELVQGRGNVYLYFSGKDADSLTEQGLYGWTLRNADPVEFIQEFERRKAKYAGMVMQEHYQQGEKK